MASKLIFVLALTAVIAVAMAVPYGHHHGFEREGGLHAGHHGGGIAEEVIEREIEELEELEEIRHEGHAGHGGFGGHHGHGFH